MITEMYLLLGKLMQVKLFMEVQKGDGTESTVELMDRDILASVWYRLWDKQL